MPHKQPNPKTTAKRKAPITPREVMGSQGEPARLMLDHFRNRPTKNTPFPGGKGQA